MVLIIVSSGVCKVVCLVHHRIVQSPIGCKSVFVTVEQTVARVFDFVCRVVGAVRQCAVPQSDFVDIAVEAFTDCHYCFITRGGYLAGGSNLFHLFTIDVEPKG